MVERFQEDPETREAAAEKTGFNSTWEYIKHVGKTTLMTALKGAVIGGLVLAALSLPLAAPLGGLATVAKALSFGLINVAPGATVLSAAALQGATLFGLAGAAIGLAKGFGSADEAVEDAQSAAEMKVVRANQLQANKEMLAMNLERLRGAGNQPAMGVGGYSPGISVGQGYNQGVGRDIG